MLVLQTSVDSVIFIPDYIAVTLLSSLITFKSQMFSFPGVKKSCLVWIKIPILPLTLNLHPLCTAQIWPKCGKCYGEVGRHQGFMLFFSLLHDYPPCCFWLFQDHMTVSDQKRRGSLWSVAAGTSQLCVILCGQHMLLRLWMLFNSSLLLLPAVREFLWTLGDAFFFLEIIYLFILVLSR